MLTCDWMVGANVIPPSNTCSPASRVFQYNESSEMCYKLAPHSDSGMTISLRDPSKDNSGLILTYDPVRDAGGYFRSVVIHAICNLNTEFAQLSFDREDKMEQASVYHFIIQSKYACFIPAVCAKLPATNPMVCHGRGKCIAADICACNTGYVGTNCEYAICDGFSSGDKSVCSSNGACVGPEKCDCNFGYSGKYCGSKRDPLHILAGFTIAIETLVICALITGVLALGILLYRSRNSFEGHTTLVDTPEHSEV